MTATENNLSSSSSPTSSSCVVGVTTSSPVENNKMMSGDNNKEDQRSTKAWAEAAAAEGKDVITPTKRLVFDAGTSPDATSTEEATTMATTSTPRQTTTTIKYYRMDEIRNHILLLSERAGNISKLFRKYVSYDNNDASSESFCESEEGQAKIQKAMSLLLKTLITTSNLFSINLRTSIITKMELNRRKYPVELCQGKAGKYTEYSNSTGITREVGQSILKDDHNEENKDGTDGSNINNNNTEFVSLHVSELTDSIHQFAVARKWERFHKPRSLLIALLGELGEFAELFQWKPDIDRVEIQTKELDKASQELADVSIYLLRLASVCGIELIEVNDDDGDDEN